MAAKIPKKLKNITFVAEGKECIIWEPGFDQISFGLNAMASGSGAADMPAGGKAIFDVCKVSCDKEIEGSGILMYSICLKIAEKYLLPVQVDIKKN